MKTRKLNINTSTKKLFNISIIFVLILFTHSLSVFSQQVTKQDLQSKIKELQEKPNFQKDTVYIGLLYQIGIQYSEYNLDSLRIVSNQTIKLSKKINYPKGEILGYINLGSYYSNIGKQNEAITYFTKALAKAETINDVDLILESRIKLAVEYKFKENYTKALEYYLKAIEIAKTYHKNTYLSRCYVNISVIYSIQKEYNQTILFLTKAMELNKENGDQLEVAKTLTNMSECYIKKGNYKKATSAVNHAISVFKTVKLDPWIAFAYELKGSIFLEQNKFEYALFWLKKSEDIHKNIDKSRYKIPLNMRLAKAYLGLNDLDIAEYYAIKALELSKKLKIIDKRDIILDALYSISKAKGEPEKALSYLEELKAILDTINKKNNIKELRILKSNLEFEQKKEQYIVENEQKQIKQRSYIYFAILIIIAFLIIIILLKRNNEAQNSLNQKLIKNTEELKKNQAHLNDVNNTKNKLFSIIAHDLKGPINSFKSLFDLFNKSELNTTEFLQFMPQIGKNIDSIAFTLNNLLTWGQTQMNGLITEPGFTNIKALVDENTRLLSKQAETKSIQTINTIDSNVFSWCDKNQIDVVIRNLISNAVKFTRKHGSIIINATENTKFWQIEIKDDGVGISKKTIINIFKEKDTSTSYGTMNEKGTGLGLRVCKEMVKNNGGRIWVESELNKGTSFYFTIPKSK